MLNQIKTGDDFNRYKSHINIDVLRYPISVELPQSKHFLRIEEIDFMENIILHVLRIRKLLDFSLQIIVTTKIIKSLYRFKRENVTFLSVKSIMRLSNNISIFTSLHDVPLFP